MAVTLGQIHYVNTLRFITHPQLSTGAATDDSEESLHKLYMSLLGAVAYLAHTRLDLVVFVFALQRHSAKSQLEHVKRLNRLPRWIQRNPKKLHYSPGAGSRTAASTAASSTGAARKLPDTEHPMHVRVFSDAAFKRESDDGYSLRGALYLRCPGVPKSADDMTCFTNKADTVHVIDWACKTQ